MFLKKTAEIFNKNTYEFLSVTIELILYNF